jgi:hypothetical protein
MKNVDDELPVFEPPTQSVQVKKTAAANVGVYYIQAYDPDGSGLTFQLSPSRFLFIALRQFTIPQHFASGKIFVFS